ncbi:MAG: diacylglycerol kinase family protein [Prosthecobacter sp.]|nr:diacylglycerol kinase family protein [Prosthecobacter sp.]
MVARFRALIRSFRFAGAGIAHTLRTEKNLQIHALATVAVVALGFLCEISAAEWCAVLLAIGLVWAVELLNSAIERLGNAITRDTNEHIRHAKDAAAGAVLLAAVAAAAVGAIVFLPKLAEFFQKP